jgi:hypothetical protein
MSDVPTIIVAMDLARPGCDESCTVVWDCETRTLWDAEDYFSFGRQVRQSPGWLFVHI